MSVPSATVVPSGDLYLTPKEGGVLGCAGSIICLPGTEGQLLSQVVLRLNIGT